MKQELQLGKLLCPQRGNLCCGPADENKKNRTCIVRMSNNRKYSFRNVGKVTLRGNIVEFRLLNLDEVQFSNSTVFIFRLLSCKKVFEWPVFNKLLKHDIASDEAYFGN